MLSDLAIKRPVLATVASALIIVIGLAALLRLPVRELPDVDAAVVTVTTTYTGAAPEIVDTEITEIVESAVSGIDGIDTINSTSSQGRSRTVIEFVQGRDIDAAANDVRDAIGRIQNRLPDDAEQPRIVKADSDAQPIIRLSVTSDRYSAAEITDYVQRFVIDRLTTLEGVAQVDIYGQRRFAMRVWLDRRAMAARGVTVQDIETAMRRNNLELPAGQIESAFREFTVRTDTRLVGEQQFRDLVIRQSGDTPIRLGDVARIELGVEDETTRVRSNDAEAIGLGVMRQAQANTIAVSNQVRDQIAQLTPVLPEGMRILIASDDATFIKASIHQVSITLGIAMALVVLVIFAFLLSPRATLVPAITIPVAVIGTFAVVHALGFSINVLTLLALILAIGLVVDDAIVVLENIQRRIEEGEKPLLAAFLGSRQVTFAVLATSATLIAVFLPLSFLEGSVGRLFIEFGIVLASAVAISTLVALTLCAMLCSKLLASRGEAGPVVRLLDGGFVRLARAYRWLLAKALGMPIVVLAIAAVIGAGSFGLFRELPRELTPSEDRGVLFIPISSPEGATVAYTDRHTREIEAILAPLVESGEAERLFAIVGPWGQSTRAFVVATLADWGDRERSQQQIVASLIPGISSVTGVRAFPVSPAGLGQRGGSTPVRVVVGGPDHELVQEWADALVRRMEANPGLDNVTMDYEPNRPQLNLRIDRRRADDLGVDIEQIGRALQTLLASREVTSFIDRGREYPVILQAESSDRRTPSDLTNILVRSGSSGQLVPLTALVELDEQAASPDLRRFDRLPSITVQAALQDGYDLGRALDFVAEAAADILPAEARLGYAGPSREFLRTSGGVLVTFALALLVVYLVLAAQFESFIHPLVIMLAVPLAVFGALAALLLTGNSLNIYSQIGLILLIGLTAKNGILIVEFANQLRDQGRSVREAILEGSALRLRPILMTVISTILGAVPLALASGAGAESRMAIGVVVIGGLGFASLLTLFVTPVLYDLLAGFTRHKGAVADDLERLMQERRAQRHQPAE
jgi:multidrug efflux pump